MREIWSRNHNFPSWRQGEPMDAIADALAKEMQDIVFAAAEPAKVGEKQKAQLLRAWEALSQPPFWRVKAAWQGAAGSWTGVAIEDMRQRDRARREREAKLRDAAEDLGALYARIARYADIDRERARHLLDLAGALGAVDRTVDDKGEG